MTNSYVSINPNESLPYNVIYVVVFLFFFFKCWFNRKAKRNAVKVFVKTCLPEKVTGRLERQRYS